MGAIYLMMREEKLKSKKIYLLPFFRISFAAGNRRSAAACECSRVQLEPLLHSGSWKRQPVFADSERERWKKATVVCCTSSGGTSLLATPTLRPVELFLHCWLTLPHKVGVVSVHCHLVPDTWVSYSRTFTDCQRVKVNLLPCFHVTSGRTR